MLRLVVTDQRMLDSLDARLTTQVAHGGEHRGIALTGDNGTDDPHTSVPGDGTDHMVQLQIHVGERLLHVLNMGCGVIEVTFA
ncbi:hypothetical protein D3C76_616620 [compost metagenome]